MKKGKREKGKEKKGEKKKWEKKRREKGKKGKRGKWKKKQWKKRRKGNQALTLDMSLEIGNEDTDRSENVAFRQTPKIKKRTIKKGQK